MIYTALLVRRGSIFTVSALGVALYDSCTRVGVAAASLEHIERVTMALPESYRWMTDLTPSQIVRAFPPTRLEFDRAYNSMGNCMSCVCLREPMWASDTITVSQHLAWTLETFCGLEGRGA